MKQIISLGAVLVATAVASSAAVFQYSMPVETGKTPSTAFLWIPPAAKQVRGVVLNGMTLAERELVKDPRIRAACAEQGLALVFLKCGLGGADLQKVLTDLAAASGYQEIAVAPLFFIGHSAGGPQAKACAIKYAERCFGLMQYRGGVPGGAEPVPPGVPALAMVGQFDEFGGLMRDENGHEGAWERGRDDIAAYRAQNARHLASIAVEPGAGHFAWSDRNAAYLALFIKKAAQARIPDWPVTATAPVQCKEIDPMSGWLTELTLRTVEFPAAAHADYKGDKTRAAWHFDKELAEATQAFHVGLAGKKDQFIKWNDGYWVDAGTRYFFTGLKWVGDGQSFEVHPAYSETYPKPQPSGGPKWLQAGEPVGHSSAPILVRQVSGPVVPTSTNTFRVQFDELAPATEGAGRVTFMAYSAGDGEFRYTEQVGMMPRGFGGFKAGKTQTISFPAVGNLKTDSAPVELKASSDAEVPVGYYVASGPAVIEGGKLKVAEVPARAQFPLKIVVVAYQYGSGVAPQVQTATPVIQEVTVEK